MPFRRFVLVSGAAALLVGGLALAADMAARRDVTLGPSPAQAGPEGWAEIRRPLALYDLSGTEFSKLPSTYRAWRHAPEGSRQDVMSFGEFGGPKGLLEFGLSRRGAAASDRVVPEAKDDLVRLGARGDFVTSAITPSGSVSTRFGAVELFDLLLSRGAISVPCRGFRAAPGGGLVLVLEGFGCGAPGRPLDAAALACAIDRIDLLSAGDDDPLRAIFVAAERRQTARCTAANAAPNLLAAASRGGEWLEVPAAPSLRGMLEVGGSKR